MLGESSNKSNKPKNCKHKSRKPLIFKMGGLICPNCRLIVYEAYSPKWFNRLSKAKKRAEKYIKKVKNGRRPKQTQNKC